MSKLVQKILICTLFCFLLPTIARGKEQGAGNFTVVIDAGHGGKDIGATDNGVMEKNVNLMVAKQLESLIKKKLKNAKVVMTRDDDTYLTLQERADIANKSQGNLFISIHVNSVDKKNKNRKNIAGSSVYTLGLHKDESNLQVAMRENSVIELENDFQQKYSGFDPQRDESYIIFEMAQKKNLSQSIKFAESVEKELVASGRKDRGVHQAGFWVLWATSMPSALIELDFICNPESAKYISSEKGVKELATAIFNAVEKYQVSWEKMSTPATLAEEVEIDVQQIPVVRAREKSARQTRHERPVYTSSDKRKRRSAVSRERSNTSSYEKESLTLNRRNYSDVFVVSDYDSTIEETDLIANNATKDSKKKAKKSKEKKEKVKKNNKKNLDRSREDGYNAKVNKLVTVYKIQVLASENLLNQNNSLFCGLSPISTYKENNIYKYYYGESTDRKELEALLADVKEKIPDAFIVSSTKSVSKK